MDNIINTINVFSEVKQEVSSTSKAYKIDLECVFHLYEKKNFFHEIFHKKMKILMNL